ncbi:MAG: rhomboid family intramembrane serine protease [Actinomycetes bacterium]
MASPAEGPGDWESGPPEVPHCYRHTDRETYIRCTRCGNPICPDCMHEASVGFHCPACLTAGNRAVRQARTMFGGTVHQDTGLVTKVLIAINVVVFLLQQTITGFEQDFFLVGQALTGDGVIGVAEGQYWRLLTAAFLHGSLLHIFFNMYLLFVLGPTLEQVFGRLRFVAIYLGSALAGSAVSYMFSQDNVPALGASGAVFGLFGATLVVGKRMRYDIRYVVVLIVLNVVLGFVIPNIDWRAHLGGLAGGTLLAAAFAYAPARLRLPLGIAASVVLAAVVVGLVAVRTAGLQNGV